MANEDNLNPEDFVETAQAVVEACAAESDLGARGRILAEAGLVGILASEEAGGLGLSLSFAAPVMQAAASGLLEFPLLETVLLADALTGIAPDAAEAILAGSATATIAWSGTVSAEGGTVGRAPMGAKTDYVLVFQDDGAARLLKTNEPGLTLIEEAGLDITRPEASFTVGGNAGGPVLVAEAVETLKKQARVLAAAMALGSAETCLQRASDYAEERRQFGKTLSANQAIRHNLARQCLMVESIRNAITRALSPRCTEPEIAASAAFAAAAYGAPQVIEGGIQIHGGMGFTWDIPLHRHLRLVHALAAQGGVASVMDAIANQIFENAGEKEMANAL